MLNSLTLPAPAKLNRMLHITGKRADGYHELQTLFQFLDLGDELTFQLTDDAQLQLSPVLPDVAEDDNLVMRAARLLLPLRQNKQLGVHIHLQKNLPMGGGLGAGSSDAATTLLALNQLWQLNLDLIQLAKLGLKLGADVPVFIFGQSAWAEGVGEKLQVCPVDESVCLLIHPGCHCNTATLFAHPDLPRNTPVIHPCELQQHLGENDFEALVLKLYPAVQAAFYWLRSEGATPHLTGSGACVYSLLPDFEQAAELLTKLPTHFAEFPSRGWITQGQNLSPAHKKLSELKGSLFIPAWL
ncbi:MAG: 4-(cytidine 5'-diphospho)-2-C-methyl-D-erythritol kinase [Marinospirillum sp.]|uniref:4-(cytidine 5'-diphospho)-2-C-methyl-D-erythritol kinase n=1 Tax=Marinospirillum sp. TaxID=2183934 RepID=UPI001A0AE566|nr:4-(cytidine 5'-diphospho)-2-C-methyl-D-erythritol kinase [Marinospirillum sp.]MBE0506625.1 4-(cytidine 5'-diphospho)-2-C-methyl-D-erythritol kinase [Marinospirillum sp.]